MLENHMKLNLIEKVTKKIQEKEEQIKKANQIDQKYYYMQVKIEKLLEISEELKKQNLEERQIEDEVIIFHKGNPYLTYILAIKALFNEVNMKIAIDEIMLATNLVLIKIIEEVKKEIKLKTKIELENSWKLSLIKNPNMTNTKIIILGDRVLYGTCLKEKIKNIQYNGHYNISIYIEKEGLQGLKNMLINYCDNNFIEIEIYEAENVREAIEQLKIDNDGERILLLTKEEVENSLTLGMHVHLNENLLKDIEKQWAQESIW